MNKLVMSLVTIGFLAACEGQAQKEAVQSDALSAPGGDQCALITRAAIDELRVFLEDGVALCDQDHANYGVDGRYNTAPSAAGDAFRAAIDELDELEYWLDSDVSDGDPNAFTYSEGAWTAWSMWMIQDQLQYSVWWAGISAIYHTSNDGRGAMEDALTAIELANELRAKGMRCYVDAHFPPL